LFLHGPSQFQISVTGLISGAITKPPPHFRKTCHIAKTLARMRRNPGQKFVRSSNFLSNMNGLSTQPMAAWLTVAQTPQTPENLPNFNVSSS
jgi:hypothetical protein